MEKDQSDKSLQVINTIHHHAATIYVPHDY